MNALINSINCNQCPPGTIRTNYFIIEFNFVESVQSDVVIEHGNMD